MKTKIDPKRIYNITEMRERKMFWWATDDHRAYKRIIERDTTKTLEVNITGKGRRCEYRVTGSSIIKFLDRYGECLAMNAYKLRSND